MLADGTANKRPKEGRVQEHLAAAACGSHLQMVAINNQPAARSPLGLSAEPCVLVWLECGGNWADHQAPEGYLDVRWRWAHDVAG